MRSDRHPCGRWKSHRRGYHTREFRCADRRQRGWGVIPVHVRIGETEFKTSLFPKDGRYLVPHQNGRSKAENIGEEDKVKIRLEIRL
ncbi:MAG: DUF1905 domain-containing protein [Anaerolineales bacterium]|nr:DUF1905 domain-containing protein [Anaerolineales bacterium]